ncbi:MAG: glycosyltransferase family 1 protein [Anaerolineae bacterium]|nr:glycosyltransferase family 1 protein [Anaerolineae bacterium]
MNSIEIPQLGEEFNLNPPPPDTPLASARRVAIVAEAFLPKFDGVAKTALITLRHLQLTGREVLVFAPDTAPDTIGPSQVVRLPSISMPLYPKSRVALPNLAIRNHLASFKPDIIHLFSPALFSFSAAIIGLELSIPLVANYQTDLPGYAEQYGYPLLNPAVREWLKLIHNLCHLTLAPSTFTLNQIRGWGFKRVRYWGRGVNSQRFHPGHRSAAWRSRLLAGRPEDSLLCIYVGRLAVEKRIDLLRQVADVPGVALTIIGDGAAREELEKLYAGTGTLFTGYLFGSDLAAAYASADVFTFTGTHETFGQVTLEALASGLPVVVANSGGVTDMAIPGKTGIICDIYPESFAAAALELRDSPALRQQLACGAREFALHRPWEVIMAQLEGYYTEALKHHTRWQRMSINGGRT